jgi:hypothetical protein
MQFSKSGHINGWLVFLLFAGISLGLYYPTIGAGFVTDFIGWQMRYEQGSAADILRCFGYPGLHQLLHLVFYPLYRLAGTQGWPWYLMFSVLHAFNGFLLFALFRKVLIKVALPHAFWISVTGALLFLVSPYQSEVVVWKVCLHYLMTASLMLGALHFAWHYVATGRLRHLIFTHLVFGAALFMLEIAFVLPLWMLVWVPVASRIQDKLSSLSRNLATLVLPQFLMLAGYFLLNKAVLGQWVGHYGEVEHFKFPLRQMVSAEFKYLLKHLFFLRYLEHPVKESIFGWVDEAWVHWSLAVGLAILGLLGLLFFKKIAPRWLLTGSSVVMFFLAVAPVSNLYFYYLLYIENDRYGYHASMFLSMAVVLALFRLPRWFCYALLGLWLLLSLSLTVQTNRYWAEGREIYYGLLEDFFGWYDRCEVIVLNIPDNYAGAYMFRIVKQDSGLPDYLKYSFRKEFKGKIYDVAQFNMMTPRDGVSVTQENGQTLKVMFNQWGNWWWRDMIGASNYENERYRLELIDNGYLLHLKQIPEGTAIIYHNGAKWEEFELEK